MLNHGILISPSMSARDPLELTFSRKNDRKWQFAACPPRERKITSGIRVSQTDQRTQLNIWRSHSSTMRAENEENVEKEEEEKVVEVKGKEGRRRKRRRTRLRKRGGAIRHAHALRHNLIVDRKWFNFELFVGRSDENTPADSVIEVARLERERANICIWSRRIFASSMFSRSAARGETRRLARDCEQRRSLVWSH